MPSRLTPVMRRGSESMAWAAVAPPRECPNIPTFETSRPDDKSGNNA